MRTYSERRFELSLRSDETKPQHRLIWTRKSTNLEETAGNVESAFVISAALWTEKLGSDLEYCGNLEMRSENLQFHHHWRPFDSNFYWKERGWQWNFRFSVVGNSQISLPDSVADTLELRYGWSWALVCYTLFAIVSRNGLTHSLRKATLCLF